MRGIITIAATATLAFWAQPAQAWGASGHRAVCEVALRNLTPRAKAEVTRLLASQTVVTTAQPLNLELGWACDYPDRTVPGGPTRRDPEHFVNYPRTQSTVELDTGCGSAHECVDNAIVGDLAILRSTAVADRHRAVALMYLGHWVGDIHQPLHNSFEDDRGGGKVNTSGNCTEGLHNAWDTCILQRRFLGVAVTTNPPIETIRTLAASWSGAVTDVERAEWLSSAPWQWSRESYEVTVRPEVGYCIMVQNTCQYDATHLAFDAAHPRTVPIDPNYETMAMPIIQRRITQAGIRLAHLINTALDPAYRPGWW
jgi:hypothetical protein